MAESATMTATAPAPKAPDTPSRSDRNSKDATGRSAGNSGSSGDAKAEARGVTTTGNPSPSSSAGTKNTNGGASNNKNTGRGNVNVNVNDAGNGSGVTDTATDAKNDGTAAPVMGLGRTTGQPPNTTEFKKQQGLVKSLIAMREETRKRLAQVENSISLKENDYIESTPNGNIIIGFDHYTKGTGGAAAARRKTGPGIDQIRVFSRSSVSYRPGSSAASGEATPVASSAPASHAPTPLSTVWRDGPGVSTPTSAGGASGGTGNKKRKLDDDSDDGGNKKRTNFGAGRK